MSDSNTTRASRLADDWMDGVPLDRGLVQPVVTAREHLQGIQHADAVRLWESFLDVAGQWKQQYGVEAPRHGLLQSLPFRARMPWQCAGTEVQDPIDLLTEKLIGFGPYDQLERDYGRHAILAAVCLAHAAEAPNTHLRDMTVHKAIVALEQRLSVECIQTLFAKAALHTANLVGPTYKLGVKFSRTQTEKGRRGAAARWDGNEARDAVSKIIAELAALTDELDDPLPPEDLWPQLYARMDNAGMAPRERDDPPRYECDDLPEPLTREAFRRRIQRARQ